jgi:hypothetical protein
MAMHRKRHRVLEVTTNAQAIMGVKWLARAYSGLEQKGYKIRPTVSDLLKTCVEAICLSTRGAEFQTDREALAFLKVKGIFINVDEDKLNAVSAYEAEKQPLCVPDASLADVAASMPREFLELGVTPEQYRYHMDRLDRALALGISLEELDARTDAGAERSVDHQAAAAEAIAKAREMYGENALVPETPKAQVVMEGQAPAEFDADADAAFLQALRKAKEQSDAD